MLSYNEARELLETARNKDAGKPLENNTRLFERNNGYAIRLHETDIVLILPDGRYVLNSGGWRTVTTKARINEYSPANVYQEDFVWYVGYPNGTHFHDGMVIGSDGVPFLVGGEIETYHACGLTGRLWKA